jgi:DcaP outer membrane protein
MKDLVQISRMPAITALLTLVVSSGVWAQERLDVTQTASPSALADEINELQEYPATQVPAPPAEPRSGYVPPQDFTSKPPPFTISPNSPVAADDGRFFSGFAGVQDFSKFLPGTFANTKYKWYGFVRVDGIYDFHPMGSTDDFVTSTIPVPQQRGQNAVLTPRSTRIGFDTETPLDFCDWTVKTRIETDFFNGNTSGAFGSFPIRLRFAWVDVGPFLIGQTASLFMDYDVFPKVVDYEGPGGMVLVRQPLFAIRQPIGEKMKVTVGIEQPYSDIQWFNGTSWVVNPGTGIITTPGVPKNIQDMPDLTANFRYVGDNGHVQVAGIGRKLTYLPAIGSAIDRYGYGFNLTGSYHPWAALSDTPSSGDDATPLSKSRVSGQYAAGHGISRYIQDSNGAGLDATFDPANGFQLIPAYGWLVSYEQWWTTKWASNFTYGQNSADLTSTLPGTTYKGANYIAANLVWFPYERFGVGLEYLHGYREDKDGQKADNTRIQLAIRYGF